MHDEEWIDGVLARRAAEQALRAPRPCAGVGGRIPGPDGREVVSFLSNDYLDLARHPLVVGRARQALDACGAGSGSARLVGGDLPPHRELEEALAAAKGYEACLLFGSGYLANLGILSALCGREDRIYADRLAHACLVDGARLSGATLVRFRHNDAAHLAELLTRDQGLPGRRAIATESVFSMDGDLAPLREIADLARAHHALLLADEAHATGVLGPAGAGRVAGEGLQDAVNLCMGTLSKGLGSYGGFVCCTRPMRDFLVNHARTFLFATALPPAAAGAALGALEVLRDEPDRPRRLQALAAGLRDALHRAGWDTGPSSTQIVPVMAVENARALELAGRLEHAGFAAAAIRPPTVPEGRARVRLSVTLAHRPDDLAAAVQALGRPA